MSNKHTVVGLVKGVDISEYERRDVDSSTIVTFSDDTRVPFEEFSLSPKQIGGLEIEFVPENPVQTLRCVQPFTYLARGIGISKVMERDIEERYLENDDPKEKEKFFRDFFLKIHDSDGKGLPKIKGLGSRAIEKFKDFIVNLVDKRLFIPFSIKYELFLFIHRYMNDPTSYVSVLFDDTDAKEWFTRTYERLINYSTANGAINHDLLTAFVQNAFNKGGYDSIYVVFLLNRMENVVYRKVKSGLFADAYNIKYDALDKSDMYAPFFIEDEKTEFDFSKKIDLTAYYNTLTVNRSSRYGYFDYDKAQLFEKKHLLFPYFCGNIMLEAMICGLNQRQVAYFLKNLASFETNSPYSFLKNKDDASLFTLKEVEMLIKKSAFNRSYVLNDSINSFIRDRINLASKEHIFIDAVNIKRGNYPVIKDRDGKEFYSYSYKTSNAYAKLIDGIYNNIDIKGFLSLTDYDGGCPSREVFQELLEIHLMNNTQCFITQGYKLEEDDELLLYGRQKDRRPYPELPYFTKIGLVSDDEIENLVYKKLVEGSKAKPAFKDDGLAEEWICSEEIANGENFHFTEEQKIALRQAYLVPRLFVLSGYAGTGKSTITRSIVNRFKSLGYKQNIGCALAGVAASRLANLTDMECVTIHSLLAYAGGKLFLAPTHLDYDLVVVDEASMIDADLFKELLIRIDFSKTSLLIIGDDAQLPPIGKGEPFSDIINAIKDGYYAPCNAVLTKIQRSAGQIVAMANDIRSGKVTKITDEMYHKEATQYLRVEERVDFINSSDYYNKVRVDSKYADAKGNVSYELYRNPWFGRCEFQDVRSEALLADKMFELLKKYTNLDPLAFRHFQIISPSKNGNDFATTNLNDTIQAKIFAGTNTRFLRVGKKSGYYEGDKVIHIRNTDMKFVKSAIDPFAEFQEERIYNGQLGRVRYVDELADTLEVIFEDSGQIVRYDSTQAHDFLKPAYVLTAHKVQGNEFKTVVNIIPFVKTNIVGRRYLYSSFTRAKENLYIIGKREYFDSGLEEEPKRRNTKLYKLFKDNARAL